MSTRRSIKQANSLIAESIGIRENNNSPLLSPVPQKKDVGRKSARSYGKLSLEKLKPDPDQPRVEFGKPELEQLALSLKSQGQLQPIRVRWSTTEQVWLVVSGERRYRAAILAGMETIDCYFDEADSTESKILEQQLVENLLRENLQPMEEARAFSKLMAINGWDGKDLAAKINVSRSKVSRALALLKLPLELQEAVESGELSSAAAYEVSKMSKEKQIRFLEARANEPRTPVTRKSLQSRNSSRRKQGTKLHFETEGGWKVSVNSKQKGNYHEVAEALRQVIEEVELRIDNNVVLT